MYILCVDQADEEIYHSGLLTIHSLLMSMTEVHNSAEEEDVLSREEFQTCLTNFFPNLTDPSSLLKAVDLELEKIEAEEIEYKTLFTEVSSVCLTYPLL